MSSPDEQKPAPAPSQPSGTSATAITLASLASALLGVIGAAAGAGWPGVVAMALVGLAIPLGWSTLVNIFNDWVDKKDQERAGTDAGKTAQDLQIQGREVTTGLAGAEQADPPTEGFPKKPGT